LSRYEDRVPAARDLRDTFAPNTSATGMRESPGSGPQQIAHARGDTASRSAFPV